MGDGYYAGAIVGDTAGIQRFTLTWSSAHRDAPLIQGHTYTAVPVGSVVPRPLYLRQFFARQIAAGNRPFWIRVPDSPVFGSRSLVLCKLTTLKINQKQDSRNPLLYNYSVSFAQVRGVPAQT